MNSRDELGLWMLARNYCVAAEIGVWRADFSAQLLSTWGGTLHMIDAWQHLDNYIDQCNLSNEAHEQCFQQALRVAEQFQPRAVVWRKQSPAAAAEFPDHFFDLVYLDANHSYGAVKADLVAWLPKIRPGGAFCGHDYMDGVRKEGVFGVKTAVNEFFGRPPEIVTNDYYPSWYYTI